MGTGYTRQSSSEIVDAQTIFASHFNNEFDLLESAFSGISGHSHDGTLGEGPLISLVNSVTGTLPIGNGGTGGTSAGDARTNLGLGTIAVRNGPGTTVDNTIPRFDGTTGNFQTSNIVVSDAGVLTLSTQKITGVADGTNTNDVINFGQLSGEVTALELVDIELQNQIDELDGKIGDFKDTARTLDSDWLRRDGSLYDSSSYPTLAALMPELSDGIIWDTYDLPLTDSYALTQSENGIYYGGASNNILVSEDGTEWAVSETLDNVSTITGLTSGLGLIIGTSLTGRIISSPDGANWGVSSILASSGLLDVCYSPSLELFCAVGTVSSDGVIYTSDDGTSWTLRHTETSYSLFGVRFLNGNFVAVGANGRILTSPDGTTWTSRSSGVSVSLNGSAFSDSTYIVFGASGTILSSTNLSSWTPRTSGVSTLLRRGIGTPDGFVVVGATGVVRISSTGTTWEAAPTGITSNLQTIVVDNNNTSKFVILSIGTTSLVGFRTSPTQFRVPNDNPEYGWIRALVT